MNNLPASSPPAPLSGDPVELLRADQRRLRLTLLAILVGMIFLAAAVNVLLLRQVGSLRRQAGEMRAFVTDYQSNSLPVIEQFIAELRAFAATNPDFKPILKKYVGDPDAPRRAPPPSP